MHGGYKDQTQISNFLIDSFVNLSNISFFVMIHVIVEAKVNH